jgi:AAA-like domain
MRDDQPDFEYYVGGSLPLGSPTYVMRQADTDLFTALSSGRFCYVLNSRQMGKSSLRIQTARRLRDAGSICASVDLSLIGSQEITRDQWYAGIVRVLANSFGPFPDFDLRTWWKERSLLSPSQKFGEFIDYVLSFSPKQYIVFIDEIDSILALQGGGDDFFAVIRSFYNLRAEDPRYLNITFALLGVADPSDLIQDKIKTPFNIGGPIVLRGFTADNVEPLLPGLASDPVRARKLMSSILSWTGGQPFLTQKLCMLVSTAEPVEAVQDDESFVSNIVRTHIITDWEVQDDPEHLKTIRNRIIESRASRTARLLGLYADILERASVESDDSAEQIELRLSGLVIEENGRLRVHNSIYEKVFSLDWVRRVLKGLRPYSESMDAWLKSEKADPSRLLRGEALKEAKIWAATRSLGEVDYQYLAASQELIAGEMERNLAAEVAANEMLTDAKTKAEKRLKLGLTGLIVATCLSAILAVAAASAVYKARASVQRLADERMTEEKLVSDKEASMQAVAVQTKQLEESQAVLEKRLALDNSILANVQAKTVSAEKAVADAEAKLAQQQAEATEARKIAEAGLLEVERQKKIAEARLRMLNAQDTHNPAQPINR